MAASPEIKPRKSFGKGLLLFVVGMILLILVSALWGRFYSDELDGSGEKIGLVKIEGMIVDSSEIVRQLSRFRRDDSVKGIIVRIDSPGGAVAPSQEIYDEVLRIRADKKPVYASMGSLAASGGYYIAAATDRIIANPGTLTGSIGVIMAFANAEELISKLGLKPEVVKSGKFKDTGSPVRRLSLEERRYLQNVVDDVHQQFIEAVSNGRNMKLADARKLADGRIFTGKQALNLKMVDELGGLEDAITKLGAALGIEGRPKVVTHKPRKSFMDWLMGTSTFSRDIQSALLPARYPSLQYLWIP